ncbi:ABC transporter permease, partial [bacterium]|nr:ABC transporter permease [bacterium]
MKRLSDYLITVLIILLLSFSLPRLLPGDPVSAIFGEEAIANMSEEMIAQIKERMGLDKPLWIQFLMFLKNIFRGDLGYSYYYREYTVNIIKKSFPWTLALIGVSLSISSFLGFLLGLNASYTAGSRYDKISFISMIAIGSLPEFLVGIIFLIIFAINLRILPASFSLSPSKFKAFLLPCISLIFVDFPNSYITTRNLAISIVKERFIETAKAKLKSESRVKYVHIGRNIIYPVITRFLLRLSHLLFGAIFIEVIFSYPGIGTTLYTSIVHRDYAFVQVFILLVSFIIVTINMLTEFIFI